jgi:hypothetical protein
MSTCFYDEANQLMEVIAEPVAKENKNCMEEPEAKLWIFTMLDSVPHPQFITLLVTLWAIWFARRKAIHEGKTTFKVLYRLICSYSGLLQTSKE